MAVTSDGLMTAAPARPGQHEAGRMRMVGSEAVQEAMELGDADGDQELVLGVGIWAPLFAAPRTSAARARRARVVWRCQPVQERTSYSSRPTRCLASSKTSSMVQRAPIARTIAGSGVSVGA